MWARASAVATGISLVMLLGPAWCAEPLATLTVEAGAYTRVDTPMSVPLTMVPPASARQPLLLEEVRGTQRVQVPAQVEPGATPRLHWILAGTLPARERRTYELVHVAQPPSAGEESPPRAGVLQAGQTKAERIVSAVKGEKELEISVGDTKVLRYHHALVPPPQDIGSIPEQRRALYNHNAFIHPLWSPQGTVLTGIHPPDHIHHLGIWMPWTHTSYEGKMVDFWNVGDGTGTVRFSKYLATTSGPVYGGFQAEQDHVARKSSKGEQTILKEAWDVRVYNVGGPEKGYWLVDFQSTQRCVAEQPLIQDEYRYGGFGFRATRLWKAPNADYLTSEGKTRKDGHTTRARWCDCFGQAGDEWQGVTFFSHPQNFRHPEPMRLWPEPDNYIFFNFAPSQLGPWEMKPGADHVFRYRWYVHEGKPDVEQIERIWHDYAEPPQVNVSFNRPEKALVLFDGTDFSQWQPEKGGEIGWKLAEGTMQAVPGRGSIMTKRDFADFILHVEFRTPPMPEAVKGQGRGNSGIYLQRRYEIQILDSFGLPAKNNECGSIYTFKAPDRNVCRPPGEWQTYDILFHAARWTENDGKPTKTQNARVTVFHNSVLIHDDVEVPRKTGAGQPEGPQAAPVLLQEHGSEVCFRNVWVLPLDG